MYESHTTNTPMSNQQTTLLYFPYQDILTTFLPFIGELNTSYIITGGICHVTMHKTKEFFINKKLQIHKMIIKLKDCYDDFKMFCEFTKENNIIMSNDFYTDVVKTNGQLARHIPEENRSPGLYKTAVQQNGGAIQNIPEEFITNQLVKLAIMKSPWVVRLRQIRNHMNDELCMLAYNLDQMVMRYMPQNLITSNMCYKGIDNDVHWVVDIIPRNLMTQQMCDLIINKDPMCLRHIPEQFQTDHMYKLLFECICKPDRHIRSIDINIVKRLQHIPFNRRTKEVCHLAIKQSPNNLEHVPNNLKTYEFCLQAVQYHGRAIRFVPDNFITKELCDTAVKQNGYALRYVSLHLHSPQLYEKAVQDHRHTLSWIPHNLRTIELCKLAVYKNGWALQYVPQHLRTPKLCTQAVLQSGRGLHHITHEHQTYKLCKIAVIKSGTALRDVAPRFYTTELCIIAIKQNGHEFSRIQPNFITPEFCDAIIEHYKSHDLITARYKDLYYFSIRGIYNSRPRPVVMEKPTYSLP